MYELSSTFGYLRKHWLDFNNGTDWPVEGALFKNVFLLKDESKDTFRLVFTHNKYELVDLNVAVTAGQTKKDYSFLWVIFKL